MKVGDQVIKVTGDYKFSGEIVAVIKKKSGLVRFVVENDDSILHIFSRKNIMIQTTESSESRNWG